MDRREDRQTLSNKMDEQVSSSILIVLPFTEERAQLMQHSWASIRFLYDRSCVFLLPVQLYLSGFHFFSRQQRISSHSLTLSLPCKRLRRSTAVYLCMRCLPGQINRGRWNGTARDLAGLVGVWLRTREVERISAQTV